MSPIAPLAYTKTPGRSIAVAGLLLGLAMAASGCGRASSPPAELTDCCATTGSPANDSTVVEHLALDRITLPTSRLVDQDGRSVDLANDLVGTRVAAIQFIFTRCATTCPILANQFERVRDRLGDGMGRDFALISITVDPEYDRPETLKAWGRRYGIGPGWSLLTGSKAEVDRVLRRLGMPAAEPQNHQSQVVIVDGTSGQGLRTSGLASPAELVAILRQVRRSAGGAGGNHRSERRSGPGHIRRQRRGRGTLLHQLDPGRPVGPKAAVLPRPAPRQNRRHQRILLGVQRELRRDGKHAGPAPGATGRAARPRSEADLDHGRLAA